MMPLLRLLFLLTAFFPGSIPWERITTDQISFLFPNHPQKLEKLINNIPSTIYQTKDLTCVLGVVCSDISVTGISITPENIPPLYEEFKKGSLLRETAKLKNETNIPSDSIFIKEIEYTIIKENHEMTYFKRFIFKNKYIFQISIGGRSRHRDIIEAEKDIFFNSISFPSSDKE
ncbi:hypothetical protein [Odoribacter sp. Z80]|uniref:hypothetical protein n=1 Tax=Odoribacter sp. Z80 TaxID=2304575 RepID=UPI00137AD5E0|nr:hypothetical protein [Odoribacter sp. Z80]NCE72236.1 hypothetical protein [Odoribacter sp. Z80]